MPEISCRTTASLLEALQREGRDLTPLEEGLPCDLGVFRDPKRSTDWETYARLLANVSKMCTREELEQIGADLLALPSWPVVRLVPLDLLSPLQLARLSCVFGTAMFPTLQFEVRRIDEGRFTLTVEIPPQSRGAPAFFHITKGQWEAIMTLVGYPGCSIEEEVDDHRGHFVFSFEPRRPWWGRIRQVVGMMVAAPAWARELELERRDLRVRFEEMNRWRRDFHRVLDELQDAVVIHRDGRILYANPALLRALRRSGDEVMNADLATVFDAAELRTALQALERGGARLQPPSLTLTPSGGAPLSFVLRQRQAVEFDGAPATLLVAQDVTEQQRMREQLLHADRMSSLGTLAGGIAHEVNNPLGYLLNSLQIMQRDLHGPELAGHPFPGRERLEQMLEVAVDGAHRIRNIMSELKAFSPHEAVRAHPVDVRRAIASALEVALPQLDDRLCVIRELDEVPPVTASESWVGQVFLNLILNAGQALAEMDHGSRTMWLRCFAAEDGQVVAEVEDDGVGIPKEHEARIFDPFFTTKPAGIGTGLGLAICRDLVARLGGTITVDSEVGRGTRVRVTLPVGSAEG